MVSALGELELEGLGEFETELEHELEHELEQELELEGETPESFAWSDIGNWAQSQWRAIKTPGSWQNTAVRLADRAILAAAPKIGSAIGGSTGADIGSAIQSAGTAIIPPEWRESELEGEFETEFELEGGLGEISPVSRIYPDAMMEHLGHAAMEAESELEAAEGFAPLVPLVASKLVPLAAKAAPRVAAKVLPRVAHVVHRVSPHLTRSVVNLTRTLHRHPQTRPLLRVVPSITRRAVTSIARHAAAGRPMSPHRAVRILAHQNHRVLSNPHLVRAALRRSRAMDHRYHRLAGIPATGPHYRWRWRHGLLQPGTAGVASRAGIVGPGAARVCPSCGTTTVHAGRGGGCKVIVVR
jgi:hypothetical protein